MEDKVLNLIEKMYIEFSGRFDNVDNRFDKLEKGQEYLENRMTKLEINIENNISKKIDALFEFREITNEKLTRNEERIDKLNDSVSSQDLRLHVLEKEKQIG